MGRGDVDVCERRRAEKAVGRSGEVFGNGKVNRRLLLVLLLWVVSLYG